MTDNEINQSKLKLKSRVALTDASGEILETWHSQLTERYPGIKTSDADLVNWILRSNAGELSKRQLEEIKELYFDDVKQLEWMLTQAKRAKASGEKFLLATSLFQPPTSKKKEPSQAEENEPDPT